jgi:hypothetical protein
MPGKHSETMGKGQVKINFLATESLFISSGLELLGDLRLTVHTG